jgi:hypothetical protein
MYGPKQRYVNRFEGKTIPKYYQCSHTHVSGRRCNRRTIHQKKPCDLCAPVNNTEYCAECHSMLKAFGMKGI